MRTKNIKGMQNLFFGSLPINPYWNILITNLKNKIVRKIKIVFKSYLCSFQNVPLALFTFLDPFCTFRFDYVPRILRSQMCLRSGVRPVVFGLFTFSRSVT